MSPIMPHMSATLLVAHLLFVVIILLEQIGALKYSGSVKGFHSNFGSSTTLPLRQ